MSDNEQQYVPARRTADLVVRTQVDETLVLDTRHDRVHCLPAEVTRVFEACTGTRTLAQVAEAAGVEVSVAAGCVDKLASLDLLDDARGPDRRRFLRRSVLVGGSIVALPVIQTVLAPSAFAAGCSVTQIQLTSGGQDSCTGNAAHAKYTITLTACSPNTTFYPLLSYTSDVGPTVEVGKKLDTDANGFATSGPGASVMNGKIQNGGSNVSLTLYFDKDHTQPVPNSTVTTFFPITCP